MPEPTSLPLSIDRWYPALAAGVRRFHVLDGVRSAAGLAAAWNKVGNGEALVVLDRARSRLGRALRLGRPGRAAGWIGRLPDVDRRDRWLQLPGTGRRAILVPTPAEPFVASLALLSTDGLRRRVAREVFGWMGKLGQARRMGFDELVVAVRGAPSGAGVDWLRDQSRPALAIGVGAPDRFQKAIAVALDARGDALGVVKLSLRRRARALVRHEGAVLGDLVGIAPESTFAPALYGRGRTPDGAEWLAQEALGGPRSGADLTPGHLSFLAGLSWRTSREIPLLEVEAYRRACERLGALRHVADDEWVVRMERLRESLRRRMGRRSVPCNLAHGDFTPENLITGDGHMRAYDWEHSMEAAPALYDLVHFHVQTSVLARDHSPERTLDELLALLHGGSGSGLLENAKLDAQDVAALVGLYVLHVATAEERNEPQSQPLTPDAQRLRAARMELARRLAGQLVEEARSLRTGAA